MTFKVKTCYTAVCDGCDEEYSHDYTPHWPSTGEAIDEAVDMGEWWSKDDVLLCSECKLKPHSFIASDIYPDACDVCANPADEHAPIVTAGGEQRG